MENLDQVNPVLINRGFPLFYRDKVKVKDESNDSFICEVTALDSDSVYKITLNKNDILLSKCSCEYYEKRKISCKHILASFLYVFPDIKDEILRRRGVFDEIDYNDREEALEAIKGQFIRYINVPSKFREDPEFNIVAVRKNADTFLLLDDKFRYDYEFVQKVVENSVAVFRNLPEKFRHDRNIVLKSLFTAKKKSYDHFPPYECDYISEELKKDKMVIALLYNISPYKYQNLLTNEVVEDEECADIIINAVERKYKGFYHFSSKDIIKNLLNQSKKFSYYFVSRDCRALPYAHEEVKMDKDIVLNCIKDIKYPFLSYLFDNLPDELFKDDSFVSDVLKIDERYSKYLNDRISKIVL